MGARGRLGAALLMAVCCAALPADGVLACGYHGALGNGFSALHPRSIEVAVALREAIDKGQLEALKPQPSFLAFARASRVLDDLRDRMAAVSEGRSTPGGLALLLVEAGLWTRYHVDGGRLVSQPHVSGPLAGDVTILTAEPVLQALIDGRLTVDRAIADDLLIVDGKDAALALASLRNALSDNKTSH